MTPLLQFDSVEKSFFGVRVVRSVSFAVGAGRIVGLVGENGAGKSTLMNLVGGNLRPDAGRMLLKDVPYSPATPREARVAGIGFVHQELNLFPNLSIAENLFLTSFPRRGPLIDREAAKRRAAELLARVGLNRPPATLVERLSTGERQLVEIAHALSFDARLLILDEPTTSLSSRESERLFTLVRQLRREGRSVIYISHTLGDVLTLCDDVVVLRDGEVVGSGPVGEFNQQRLVSLMVGRRLEQLFPERKRGQPGSLSAPGGTGEVRANALAVEGHPSPRPPPPGGERESQRAALLEVRGICQPGIVRDISFTLHRGEVLGISGLMGAGRTELARILFGLDPHESGTITLNGQPLAGSPRRRIQRGLAMLTESRRDDGLCLEASVADNMSLVTLEQRARSSLRLLDFNAVRSAIGSIRDAVRLQPSLRNEQPARTLSGGNQQKVVLAKWLLAEPQVLILDEPTRGIDVAAKFEIYELIYELADRGAGVLVISSELEELVGICDRIFVMSRGRITGDFQRSEFARERILQASLPETDDAAAAGKDAR